MPIDRGEFESGQILNQVEKAVISFLNVNKNKAFTISEIMDGINLQASFKDLWNVILFVIGIAAFHLILNSLVTSGKIRMNIIKGMLYYMAK
jgi:hypothetical protein